MMAGNNLAMAAAVVVSMGSSAIGIAGTTAELAIKEIDQAKFPQLRAVAEVFAKTVQSASAAFTLLILGSLFVTSTPGVVFIASMGVAMLLTPTINEMIQTCGKESWKNNFEIADRSVAMMSKAINTGTVTAGFFMACGAPIGVVSGICLTALSVVTYQKI